MKKGLVIAAIASFIVYGFTGCQDLKKKLLPTFNVKIPPINLTIPPVPFVSKQEIAVGALRTHINMDSTIRANT